MQNFYRIFFLLFTISCAQLPREEELLKKENLSYQLDESYRWIENDDFKGETLLKLDKAQDYYQKQSDIASLGKESLAVMPKEKIETVIDKNDPLGQISGACYKRDFIEAFALIDKLYRRYKKNAGYWNQVGTCFLLKKEEKKALLFYNKAKELDPDYVPPLNNLGVLYLERGEDQKALLAFKEAKGKKSFSLTPVFNLSELYLSYGHSKKGKSFLTRLGETDSTGVRDFRITANLAQVYFLEGDFQKALLFFSQLEASALKRPQLGINYVYALYAMGNIEEAKENFSRIQLPDKYEKDLLNYYYQLANFIKVKAR